MKTGTLLGVVLAVSITGLAYAQDGPAFGDEVVDFKLKTVTDEEVDLKEFRKDKVAVLTFGTIDCPRCVLLIPELKKVVAKYDPKSVRVLEVDVQEEAGAVAEKIKRHEIPYAVVLDPEGEVADQYGIHFVPVVIVVDKEGTIVYRGDGTSAPTKANEITDYIDAALK